MIHETRSCDRNALLAVLSRRFTFHYAAALFWPLQTLNSYECCAPFLFGCVRLVGWLACRSLCPFPLIFFAQSKVSEKLSPWIYGSWYVLTSHEIGRSRNQRWPSPTTLVLDKHVGNFSAPAQRQNRCIDKEFRQDHRIAHFWICMVIHWRGIFGGISTPLSTSCFVTSLAFDFSESSHFARNIQRKFNGKNLLFVCFFVLRVTASDAIIFQFWGQKSKTIIRGQFHFQLVHNRSCESGKNIDQRRIRNIW